ncbi:MAG: amidohydrolase family protein [Cyclobacteriaceae bacterium]
MKIDAHNHFWHYDPLKHEWIDESMKAIRRDFLPEDFLPELNKNQIDGTVAVQADQTIQETDFLLSLAAKYDFIKGVVGWVDLRAADIDNQLARYSTEEKLVGFRHIVQGEPDPDFLLRDDFQNGLSKLAQYDFTYDILIFPHQLPAAVKTVQKLPNQKFVLDHIAKPDIKNQDYTHWTKSIKELALSENVYCKLSGMVTEADWSNWKSEDFKYCLDVIFEAFGTDRLMFGSDWPVCLVAAEYAEVKNLVKNYLDKFSSTEQEKIFGKNAISFYSL